MNREDAAQLAQVQHIAGLFLADLDALKQGVDVADLFVPAGIVRVELLQRRHGRASGLGARISSTVDLFIVICIGTTSSVQNRRARRPATR